ncbi:MAG: hypothetical protein HN348_33740, partial [Proteobacteria bacterium]|nr:hypothetical protein [Pseudomonadota bacterium]
NPGFIPDWGLQLETEYRLEPDSWLLQVQSTGTAAEEEVELAMGDLLFGGPEVSDHWEPRTGLDDADGESRKVAGFIGKYNDGAVALVGGLEAELELGSFAILAELADMVVGFGPTVVIPKGESATYTRFYGVGTDMAVISDAVLAIDGVSTQAVEGVVSAVDGPVAGARVNIFADDVLFTLAVTDDDGAFEAQIPADSTASVLAVGRGPGLFVDHPPGAAPMSPFGAATTRQKALLGLQKGAEVIPMAEGRGVATVDDPLTLGQPAMLLVRVADGLPFTVGLAFTEADPAVDVALVPKRPSSMAAAGWSRDGEVRLLAESGTYNAYVHRGMRYEMHSETVDLVAGVEVVIEPTLALAYEHDGYLIGDPHSHASPSGDGNISMEDRVTVMAAGGVQLHFGTDHDHVADYRPLVAAFGLDEVMRSVVADEVSPVLRGHINAYPLE